MKPRWEMLTGWKVALETDEKSFEYFNKESFIPGHIYRIHVLNGVPIIVEFKQFGYRYNYSMTKTYPRNLICDGASDVLIENVTHIFAYNIDGEEDTSSTSTESTESVETTDASGFKDFVVSKHSYRANEKLKDVETVPRLSTDKMYINGELKIKGFDTTIDRSSFLHTQCVRIELPTGDEITIPASDHPRFETSDEPNCPAFIEYESELSWHKDLAAGEFYIVMNKLGKKLLVLIRCIHNSEIEYTVCTSRYSRAKDDCGYYIEAVTFGIKIEEAKECKFIPIKDLIC